MFLLNKRTGIRAYIAKYYPSTGWYTSPHIDQNINVAEFPPDGWDGASTSGGGMWGDEWTLQYETDQDA